MPLPRHTFLTAVARGAGASLAVLSAPLDRRSVANAQGALFERRRRDIESLRTWRELEPRLVAPPSAEKTG